MVAGVGKTYRMLSEAGFLAKKGCNVMVGLVETHGREDTEKLLEGLEIIPRKKIDYKGILIGELGHRQSFRYPSRICTC